MAGILTSPPLKHSVANPKFTLTTKSLELIQIMSIVLLVLKEWVEKAELTVREGSEVGLGLSWRFGLTGGILPQMLLVPSGCGSPGELGAAASVLSELVCSCVCRNNVPCSSWQSFLFPTVFIKPIIASFPFP